MILVPLLEISLWSECPVKRRNCLRMSITRRFSLQMPDDLHLRDLPLIGGSFTLCADSNNGFASGLLLFLNLK